MGREYDNPDHIALYSPQTLKELLSRYGFGNFEVMFVAENTHFHHQKLWLKALATAKCIMETVIGTFQPSICHGLIITATKI